MAIKNNFPNIRPSLNLDFANTKRLDPRITFSRADTGASQATYFGADGVLKYAGIGEPRFDHDPVSGESLGLLIEEQRTNLLLRSAEFENAVWGTVGASVSANSLIAPDAALSADTLVEDSSTGEHRLNTTCGATLNASVSLSLYVKAQGLGAARSLRLLVANNGATGNNISCIFTNTAGVFSVGAAVNTGNGSGAVGAVSSVGNGWYRVVLTGIPDSGVGSGTALVRVNLHTGATASYTGDGTSGIYIWGAQLEAGAFPTSYIPTTSAAVTRNPDIASMTGVNFSSWYNQSEGTLFAEWTRATSSGAATGGAPSVPRVWGIGTASAGLIQLRPFSATNLEMVGLPTGNGLYIDHTTWGVPQMNKTASAYKPNDSAACVNAGTVGTDTTVGVFDGLGIDRIGIGQNAANVAQLNGHIARLTYYPKRLSDATLQALTK
jgi:hypothetical protein